MAEMMDRKKLIDYLPPIMQNFAEMKQITQVEQKETDLLKNEIGKVLDNAFIESCDEYGIKKYEKLTGIIPEVQDSLELRKSRVILHWNNFTPYTYRALIRRLNLFCGVNNYDITGKLENFELIISTRLSSVGQITELEKILDRILPVPIVFTIFNNLQYKLTGNATLAGTIVKKTTITISTDIEKTVSLDGQITDASVVASRIWRSMN